MEELEKKIDEKLKKIKKIETDLEFLYGSVMKANLEFVNEIEKMQKEVSGLK